jgi:excisionase family DNA binding protein
MSNPIADLLADAIAIAVQRPEIIAALRAVTAPAAPAEARGLVAKAEAARALGVSVSTLDRLARDGAPVHAVGGRRRFDVSELRTWLDARGQVSPRATPSSDRVDVSDVLTRSGLRVAGKR